MPGPGYYGGLLEGMRGATDIQHEQVSTQLLKEEIPMKRLQTAAAIQDFKNQQIERKLLQQAFQSNAYQRYDQQDLGQQEQYINKLKTAGRNLMGVDPKMGLSFMKEAEDATFKLTEDKVRSLQLESGKLGARDQIAFGIKDQDSLDQSLSEFQKIGVVVPEKFKTWNPETKEFFDRWGLQSKGKKQEIDINQKILQGKLRQDGEDRKNREDAEKTRLKEIEQSLKQAGQQKEYKYEDKRVKAEMLQLSDHPLFKGLEPDSLLRAANDIDRRAFDIHQADPKIPTQYAYQMAVDEVASRVKTEPRMFGETKTYTGMEDLTKQKESKSSLGPSQDDWIAAAKTANPQATEEELKAYYESKYGNH